MSRRILLIEDDSLFRKSLTKFIASMGYEVLAADSGERGLQVMEREAVDLMVADCDLPGITGVEVARLLRERGVRIPVVLMSATSSREVAEAARTGSVDAVLSKSTAEIQSLRTTLTTLLAPPP